MKILATNGRESCICEMSKEEISKLAGFSSEYYARDKISMVPGVTIAIDDMYARAVETLNAFQGIKKDVTQAHTRMTRLIGLMDKKEDISK